MLRLKNIASVLVTGKKLIASVVDTGGSRSQRSRVRLPFVNAYWWLTCRIRMAAKKWLMQI